MHAMGSLVLLDHVFFFLYLGRQKKGLVNVLYYFYSTNPRFLGVVNWLLMASGQRQRAINR